MSCDVGCRCGSDLALLWLWRRSVATAPIGPLAWEPPICRRSGPRNGKKPKKKKKKKDIWVILYLYFLLGFLLPKTPVHNCCSWELTCKPSFHHLPTSSFWDIAHIFFHLSLCLFSNLLFYLVCMPINTICYYYGFVECFNIWIDKSFYFHRFFLIFS